LNHKDTKTQRKNLRENKMDNNQDFINALILDMLEIDDETVDTIIKETPIEESYKDRLVKEYRECKLTNVDIINSLIYLLHNEYIMAVNANSGKPEKGIDINNIFADKANIWLRVTDSGRMYYNNIYDKFWID